jgi:hypothetical protein
MQKKWALPVKGGPRLQRQISMPLLKPHGVAAALLPAP